jgi:transposase-like protein
MAEWQNRPLDRVYPVLFVDAVQRQDQRREGREPSHPRGDGGDRDGTRDILGMWAGGGEGAKYWLHVFTS